MVGTNKLDEKKVQIIRDLLNTGEFSHKQIGDLFNVSRSTITSINTNRRWNEELRSFVMKEGKVYREMLNKQDHVTINRILIELSNGERFEL